MAQRGYGFARGVAGAAAVVLSAGAARGQFDLPISDPTVVNTGAALDDVADENVRIATDGLGNWVAVWSSRNSLDGTIGVDWDLLVARSADNGSTWTDPIALNTNAGIDIGNDFAGAIAADAHGNWVVVWMSNDSVGGTVGADSDILFSHSTDVGATWSDPQPVAAYALTDASGDGEPHLATDGHGTWIAVWWSMDSLGLGLGTDRDILAASTTDPTGPWTAAAPVNTTAASDSGWDYNPVVATDGDGQWMVVWRSDDDLGLGLETDGDIVLARSSNDGATWTAPAPVNSDAESDTTIDTLPHVATDTLGAWVVVWEDAGANPLEPDIGFARSTNGGVGWSAAALLNTDAATDDGAHRRPRLAADGWGNWIAVWHAQDSLGMIVGDDKDILVARSADGASWTDPAPLNTNAVADLTSDVEPEIAGDGEGNWVAIWRTGDSDGGPFGTDTDALAASFQFGDCNGNGVPDSKDITARTSADGNGNGVPDDCEPDCNGDGIPDSVEIGTGMAFDCNQNYIPDGCEIVAGVETDCDNSGVLDACETTAFYKIDDGWSEDMYGGLVANRIWATQYDAGAGDVISSIAVAFPDDTYLNLGDPITVFLWDDPNNDGLPDDAELLASATASVLSFNANRGGLPERFDTYTIPETAVAGSFFVGVLSTTGKWPAMYDTTAPQPGRNWVVLGTGTAAFRFSSLIDGIIGPVNWLIRANGDDVNNDGLPDFCECPADVNADGSIDVLDLIDLLLCFGQPAIPPCDAADVNFDGAVDVLDLIEVLLAFGTTCP